MGWRKTAGEKVRRWLGSIYAKVNVLGTDFPKKHRERDDFFNQTRKFFRKCVRISIKNADFRIKCASSF